MGEELPELPGGKKHPPGVTKDMLKPLVFGNHQTHFKVFNALVCVGELRMID